MKTLDGMRLRSGVAIQQEVIQVQDLTPSDSGYFSHIKFDFDHARKAWRDVLERDWRRIT